jgi:hypothetical protein
MGDPDALEDDIWLVKGIDRGTTADTAEAIAARVKTLLNDATLDDLRRDPPLPAQPVRRRVPGDDRRGAVRALRKSLQARLRVAPKPPTHRRGALMGQPGTPRTVRHPAARATAKE